MIKTWRWFGKDDLITLDMLRQIGVKGVVASLYHIPAGNVWPLKEINDLNRYIKAAGLKWSVVESVPVHEAIKYGGEDRDLYIENYRQTLINLSKAGVNTVCYNFMPVVDWIRTDLNHPLEDGAKALYFDKIKFAYFDCKILNRPDAKKDYTKSEIEQVEKLSKTISESDKNELIENIIIKTQAFVSREIAGPGEDPVTAFNQSLAYYKNVSKTQLRENYGHFLKGVVPTAEKHGVKLAVHPDDPPFDVLGLPRIVTSEEDINWLLQVVDSESNGITFCAGSLSSGLHNDVIDLAKKFAHKTHFLHFRSTEVFENGSFIEAPHLTGRGNLIKLAHIFENHNPNLPMRIDHGKLMLDDIDKGHNPGYSFLGRMQALAQIEGVLATIDFNK